MGLRKRREEVSMGKRGKNIIDKLGEDRKDRCSLRTDEERILKKRQAMEKDQIYN